jgi:tRNA-splicing endonuclease subunit Sen54
MADLDEDVIHHPPSGDSAPQAEIDLSDEMQDFRFLNSLSLFVTNYSITCRYLGLEHIADR